MEQQAEQAKWIDVPEWKKNLMLEKEKRRSEEMVSDPHAKASPSGDTQLLFCGWGGGGGYKTSQYI